MNKKIGILLKNFDVSQLTAYTIMRANELSRKDINVYLFYEQVGRPYIKPLCPVLHVNEAWDFNDGILVATSLSSARLLYKSCNTSRKLFYVWDLEFTRNQDYVENLPVYRSMDLICRSLSHAQAVENYCNKSPIAIIDDMDIRRIAKL